MATIDLRNCDTGKGPNRKGNRRNRLANIAYTALIGTYSVYIEATRRHEYREYRKGTMTYHM